MEQCKYLNKFGGCNAQKNAPKCYYDLHDDCKRFEPTFQKPTNSTSELSEVKPDVNMFNDLNNWCNQGILYLKCLINMYEKSDLYRFGVKYKVIAVYKGKDDETDKNDILLLIKDNKWDDEAYVSYKNPNFEIVVK